MDTQKQTVLALLQHAGEAGINSYELTYKYSIKQAPTRIKELRDEGHSILSQTLPNRSVQYILSNNLPPLQARTRSKMKKQYFDFDVTRIEETHYYDKDANAWRLR